ncbi:RNA polymerase sigma factor [Streptomyces sp. NPDC046324]|uniref:RNA polymerase sigma factor n=1 Tax=Streptomyces sp. NPDC046324 TaxID=3154915 RepID=UPI0033DAC730
MTESGGASFKDGDGRRAGEAAVIARVRAGEAEAYAALVRAHTAVALRAAVACGAGAEAEDVVQQAFFKAYRSLGRFKEGAAFRPWLLRIVVNETRNTVRAAGRQRAVAGREAELLASEPRIPEGSDPAVAAEEQERRRQLLTALDGLSEDHRQVVIHRYLLELDETETAAALGWPRGTVKSRLSRALKKLGPVLEGGDEHEGHE